MEKSGSYAIVALVFVPVGDYAYSSKSRSIRGLNKGYGRGQAVGSKWGGCARVTVERARRRSGLESMS